MAERRMFAKTIIDSDAFLDMPATTQLLYFHLCMWADDDGFINSPRKVQRVVGCSDDDLRLLIAKRFLIPFESGVVVIKHWRIHNYIRQDRYKETVYQEEKAQLMEKENKAYTLSGQPNGNQLTTKWQPNDNQRSTQYRLGKDRLGKEREKQQRFAPPTLEDLETYCQANQLEVDAEAFMDYYESNDWKVGKNKMKDWKAAARNWNRRNKEAGRKLNGRRVFTAKEMEVEEQDLDELRRKLYGDEEWEKMKAEKEQGNGI